MHRSAFWYRILVISFAAALSGFLTLPASAGSKKLVLTAADGYRISALLTVPGTIPETSGVVLIHMYRHGKESWAPLAGELAARGITSLAIDLRGHGESRTAPDGSDSSARVLDRDPEFFNSMHLDAAAALNYLEEERGLPAQRTALAGASVGCSIAIRTAIEHPVAGVVVMTPGRDYLGIPTMEHVEKWPGTPLLILTSEEEAGRGANDLYAVLKNRDAELMVFDQEGIHGTNMFGEVDGVERIIADWLSAVFERK